jgi:hypothetical protein
MMARLQPQTENQTAIQQLKPIPQEIEQKIAYTLIKLKSSSGIKDETIKRTGYALTRLAQETDLNNPTAIGEYIREMKHPKTRKPMDNATRNKYANAYKKYCSENGIQWKKPYYKVAEKIPIIPTPRQVQAIIDNSSENYVTIFTIESEIGCSPEELYQVTQDRINREKGEISIIGVKGHGSKDYKLKQQTKDLLLKYLATHTDEHPFPKAHAQSVKWSEFRERASKKLNDKELLKIDLRNLRNYSGERLYKSLPIRDPIAVMQHLRHKKLETTMHYIRAMIIDYEEDETWISLVTHSTEEECKAVEKGYTLVRAIDQTTAIYRKRKC